MRFNILIKVVYPGTSFSESCEILRCAAKKGGRGRNACIEKNELMIINDGLMWLMDTDKKQGKIGAAGGVSSTSNSREGSAAVHVHVIHSTQSWRSFKKAAGSNILQTPALTIWTRGKPLKRVELINQGSAQVLPLQCGRIVQWLFMRKGLYTVLKCCCWPGVCNSIRLETMLNGT